MVFFSISICMSSIVITIINSPSRSFLNQAEEVSVLQVHSSSKMSLSLRPAIHSVPYCMFLYYILSSNLSSDYTVQQARPIQFGLESLHNVSGCLCLHAPLCIKMILFYFFMHNVIMSQRLSASCQLVRFQEGSKWWDKSGRRKQTSRLARRHWGDFMGNLSVLLSDGSNCYNHGCRSSSERI